MKAIRIDKDGFFIEDIEVKADQTNTKEIIVTHCENGFYKPKWNGTKWVEGLTQSEIDEIKKRPVKKTEIEILRQENELLQAKTQANASVLEFQEECIVELASIVFS